MKILYVEDEIAHFLLTQRTLEDNLQQEFRLIHTDQVGEALRLLETEPDIDLVLSDLRLPDGSGLDACREILKKSPRTRVVIGARLHANFDRQEGGQNVDSADDSRRGPRLLRPGAIILPNLDIDEAAGSHDLTG